MFAKEFVFFEPNFRLLQSVFSFLLCYNNTEAIIEKKIYFRISFRNNFIIYVCYLLLHNFKHTYERMSWNKYI